MSLRSVAATDVPRKQGEADVPATERRNPHTLLIDTFETRGLIEMLLTEDARAVTAAMSAISAIVQAVDEALPRIAGGGRVHYFGAGASGRLAMLDASEVTPTFGVERGTFVSHFPGGTAGVVDSSIDLEDSEDLGWADAAGLDATSVAIGITASGSTAYVAGALRRAADVGALTILITSDPDAPLRDLVQIAVVADTGPEALTGSTRLKAGTATKVILNAFSTALMVRFGRTYSNLMVGAVPTNDKLRKRAISSLVQATGMSEADCRHALRESDGDVRVAIVALMTGATPTTARETLSTSSTVREAIAHLGKTAP